MNLLSNLWSPFLITALRHECRRVNVTSHQRLLTGSLFRMCPPRLEFQKSACFRRIRTTGDYFRVSLIAERSLRAAEAPYLIYHRRTSLATRQLLLKYEWIYRMFVMGFITRFRAERLAPNRPCRIESCRTARAEPGGAESVAPNRSRRNDRAETPAQNRSPRMVINPCDRHAESCKKPSSEHPSPRSNICKHPLLLRKVRPLR